LSLSIFRENLFFTDISEAEFRALYQGAAGSLDPDLFVFLLDPSGEPIGLCFNLADHRQPKTVNVKTFGVLPEFRYEGIGAAFAYEIYSRLQAKGFVCVNHCLMRAGNRADNFDGGLGRITREYTLFTRLLES
jgi:GNAT superfamily N-acetyltransferase